MSKLGVKCPHCGQLIETFPSPTDYVIGLYYRRKARGVKVTLRQIAEEHGYNYSYLSQVKVAYDKAGKWGSKRKETPDV